MPEHERELEKARIEWSTLAKESVAWVSNAKKARKLEANLAEMEKVMTQLQSICNTPKYTLAVFDMFRVFCKHNLNVS